MNTITKREVRALLATAKADGTIAGLMLYTLLVLLAETGIRLREALQTRLEDIKQSRKGSLLVVWSSKSQQARFVFLSKKAQKALRAWLPACPGDHPEALLFCNQAGRKLTCGYIQGKFAMIKQAAEAVCGSLVGRPVTLHSLRIYWLSSPTARRTVALMQGP
jgi:site-specific recombinase XerD